MFKRGLIDPLDDGSNETSARLALAVFLDPADFVWRAFAMFPRLINQRSRQQFCGIKFAHSETLEPRLLATREALKLRSPRIPKLDVDSV